MAAIQNDHMTKDRDDGILPTAARRVVPVQSTSIRPRMRVYNHRGEHVGQVKDVRDVDFTVDRPWRPDIRLPIKRVLAVMDQDVLLNTA